MQRSLVVQVDDRVVRMLLAVVVQVSERHILVRRSVVIGLRARHVVLYGAQSLNPILFNVIPNGSVVNAQITVGRRERGSDLSQLFFDNQSIYPGQKWIPGCDEYVVKDGHGMCFLAAVPGQRPDPDRHERRVKIAAAARVHQHERPSHHEGDPPDDDQEQTQNRVREGPIAGRATATVFFGRG